MINHVKTLLLNESYVAAREGGVPWDMDPSFRRVRVPGDVQLFVAALFDDVESVPGKAARVESAFRVASRPELAFAFDLFDPRVSPPAAPVAATAPAFLQAMSPGTLDFVPGCLAAASSCGLFTRPVPDSTPFGPCLDRLRGVFVSAVDPPMRFAACLAACAARLEISRLAGTPG